MFGARGPAGANASLCISARWEDSGPADHSKTLHLCDIAYAGQKARLYSFVILPTAISAVKGFFSANQPVSAKTFGEEDDAVAHLINGVCGTMREDRSLKARRIQIGTLLCYHGDRRVQTQRS